MKIAIIGAGVGGLSCALVLSRQGHRVSVFERADEICEIGAGLTLSPNAIRVIDHLDLRRALEEVAESPGDGLYLHYQTAEVLHRVDRSGPYAASGKSGFYQVHRSDFLDVLLKAVKSESNCNLSTGSELIEYEETNNLVRVMFSHGERKSFDVLIGGDGLRSLVRESLNSSEVPRFTGQVAWRCVVKADAAKPYMSAGTSAMFIGPGAFFNRYHVRNRSLVNCIAIAATDRWRDEGWAIPSTFEEFETVYKDWHSDVVDLMRAADGSQFFKWALYDREPVSKWVGKRVVLIGDAAHPMLPFLGMGAAFALEDAVILGRCLEKEAEIEAALEIYQRYRKDRCAQAILDSRTQAVLVQESDPETYSQRVGKAELRAAYFDYDAATGSLSS